MILISLLIFLEENHHATHFATVALVSDDCMTRDEPMCVTHAYMFTLRLQTLGSRAVAANYIAIENRSAHSLVRGVYMQQTESWNVFFYDQNNWTSES